MQLWLQGGVQPTSFQTAKKIIDFCENGLFKPISRFYYYFCCLDENKNKLRVCNKDESTNTCRLNFDEQARYFDILTRNCTRVFSIMTLHSCIKFAIINALFVATYTEPILIFVRKMK